MGKKLDEARRLYVEAVAGWEAEKATREQAEERARAIAKKYDEAKATGFYGLGPYRVAPAPFQVCSEGSPCERLSTSVRMYETEAREHERHLRISEERHLYISKLQSEIDRLNVANETLRNATPPTNDVIRGLRLEIERLKSTPKDATNPSADITIRALRNEVQTVRTELERKTIEHKHAQEQLREVGTQTQELKRKLETQRHRSCEAIDHELRKAYELLANARVESYGLKAQLAPGGAVDVERQGLEREIAGLRARLAELPKLIRLWPSEEFFREVCRVAGIAKPETTAAGVDWVAVVKDFDALGGKDSAR